MKFLVALLLVWCVGLPAQAHKASDAYFVVSPSTAAASAPQVQLSLALKDLDAAIDSLDANGDRSLSWGEIRQALPDIQRWVGAGVQLHCGPTVLANAWNFEALEKRSDGAYVRLGMALDCPAPKALTLHYTLLREVDSTHRVLVGGSLDGQAIAKVLAPQTTTQLALRSANADVSVSVSGVATLAHFFPEGLHHILTGYDHLAFLLVLLLPLRLFGRAHGSGAGAAQQPSGLGALLLTVTGFTLGHSCTLALATFGLVSASPAWVEPAIALTIAASAALNLYPLRWVRTDLLALVFGLVHGLGFSGVMIEAGISGGLLVWGLAGFNLGVEAGQLTFVALWCILHFALKNWKHYQRVVVQGGSLALLVLALYWAFQRL